MKYFYKALALFFLFIAAVIFFGRSIPKISIATTAATSMKHSTFPVIYLEADGHTVNTLHGYSSEIDSGLFRESITPVDSEKRFLVKIMQNESKIKRLDYVLKNIGAKKTLEENSLTAFDTKGKYRTARIKFSAGLESSIEYGLQITLTTNLSKKIHFYTRIKYYPDGCFLNEKLAFVKNFHDATFHKNNDFKIASYLEANTNDNSSFANVTIHSSLNMITWKKLEPKKLSKPIPVINEINIETAAISQDYFVELNTDSGMETYAVKEYYRIRYSGSRIYLLAYNRTMEAFFNPSLASLQKSEFKIGITGQKDMDILSSESNKKVAFVRNGSLWYYDLTKNKITNVFSFDYDSKDYLRDHYNQHDIKILKIDDKGNISFLLYGYMNCGDYEGRVGILLYDYDPKENQIQERIYIPLTTTYQQLKEDIGDYSYVNDRDIFYFTFNDRVYAYNISSRKYEVLTEHASKDNFSMLRGANCFIWSNAAKKGTDTGIADSITILDLDTSKRLEVSAPEGQGIIVLGTIDANIVYGFVKTSDIYESKTGEIVTPAYKLMISNCKGEILREYHSSGQYVTGAAVNDNVIRLSRVKRVNGNFRESTEDTIMNQKTVETKSVKLTTRVTQKALTEYYLALPAGFILEKMPEITSTKHIMVTENTTLHLSDEEVQNTTKYYVYANGGITESTTTIAKAIQEADEQMGTVMDNKSHIIWERGGKFISKDLSGISYPKERTTTLKACVQMLLESTGVSVSASELKGKSALSMLKKHLKTPVNLTGCTVDEILYFVSGSKPVIAMTENNMAVLITAYSPTDVVYMDPNTEHTRRTTIHAAERFFKQYGYHFTSYID